ncbi:putative siderophore biosynthesis protein SbnA [Streptomyces sp. ADI98-10]|nr:putative siderophore biosynthesis protein SbnA [Streptomyces sp. ADI98-10]
MYTHIADMLAQPALVQLEPNLFVIRFECMKVASALGVVESLIQDGVVEKGDTLVDSSSGLYALALALACSKYDLRCHIVASPAVDPALMVQLTSLGATVEQPSGTGDATFDQGARVQRVQEIVGELRGAYWMRQYHDTRHYDGYRSMAHTVAASLRSDEVVLVGGVGTGVSTAGIGQGLADRGVDPTVIGVQPFGSVSFGSQHVEDPEFLISGLGSGIPFGNIDYSIYREIHWIDYATARRGAVTVLRRHGLFAGLSSGAAYAVASWHQRSTDRPVVFISPDPGHRYLSTVFAGADSVSELGQADAPRPVSSSSELAPPWCWTPWQSTGQGFTAP